MKPTIEILSTLTDDQYTTFRMMRTRCYCWNPDAEKITFESDIGEQTMTFDTWEDARRFAESPDKNQYIRKSDVVSMLNERLDSIKWAWTTRGIGWITKYSASTIASILRSSPS